MKFGKRKNLFQIDYQNWFHPELSSAIVKGQFNAYVNTRLRGSFVCV
jgi:hypothetical protein